MQSIITVSIIMYSNTPLSIGEWSDRGCSKNEELSDASMTVCECTHLTHFAVILDTSPTTTSAVETITTTSAVETTMDTISAEIAQAVEQEEDAAHATVCS